MKTQARVNTVHHMQHARPIFWNGHLAVTRGRCGHVDL